VAIPITLQLFDAFLGVGEGVHSIILPDIFSSGGSKNVYMDKYARVKRIDGYQRQGNASTTSAGDPTLIRALQPYRQVSGGVVTRRLVGVFDDGVNEWEVKYSTDQGATWTLLVDFGAGAVGKIPDFEPFGDLLIMTNGVDAPQVINGTAMNAIGQTQLAAPALVAVANGRLSGSYRYKIVPRKTDGTRKMASVTSAVTSADDKSFDLTWIADPDVTVAGYEVYRTSGTGGLFWFVDYVDGRTTVTYSDNIDDLTILENRGLEEHGDPPPVGARYCVAHKQRMWYLGTMAEPQQGWFSDEGQYDSVSPEGKMQFKKGENIGDFIVGGIGEFEGMLVVFQERSIWTVSGTGQVIGDIRDHNRTRTNAEAGAVSQASIIRIPAGAKFFDQKGEEQTTPTVTLAYFTPKRDIRLFDGDNDIVISHAMSDTLKTLNYAQRHKVHLHHNSDLNEIAWMFPAGSNSECSTAVVWNYKWGVMYAREWGFASACEMEDVNDSVVHLGGSASLAIGGVTFQLWQSSLFDGVGFKGQWMTKEFFGRNEQGQPIPAYDKRWRFAQMIIQITGSTSLLLEWLEGASPNEGGAIGSAIISPDVETVLSADGDPILTADGDIITAAQTSVERKVRLQTGDGKYFHRKSVRLRISDLADAAESWSLEAYTLGYQVLPGLARDRGVSG
jgi:hypothetical protein